MATIFSDWIPVDIAVITTEPKIAGLVFISPEPSGPVRTLAWGEQNKGDRWSVALAEWLW